MPIRDELTLLAEGIDRELREVHDFVEHSKLAWQSYEILATERRQGDFTNVATGTTVDAAEVVARTPKYVRTYVITLTFRHMVTLLEVFLFQFLQRAFLHNPWQFADRQLDFRIVLECGTRDEIVSAMIFKQLNELKYDQLKEWFAALNKAFRLDCPTSEEIETLAEIKATRDILEHNAGIANETYLRKAGRKARYTLGERIKIDDGYHQGSWTLIRKVIADLTAAAVARLT